MRLFVVSARWENSRFDGFRLACFVGHPHLRLRLDVEPQKTQKKAPRNDSNMIHRPIGYMKSCFSLSAEFLNLFFVIMPRNSRYIAPAWIWIYKRARGFRIHRRGGERREKEMKKKEEKKNRKHDMGKKATGWKQPASRISHRNVCCLLSNWILRAEVRKYMYEARGAERKKEKFHFRLLSAINGDPKKAYYFLSLWGAECSAALRGFSSSSLASSLPGFDSAGALGNDKN